MRKVFVLNALVPPTSGFGIMKVSKADFDEVKKAIENGAECYIGHPSTAKLFNVVVNRGEAKPEAGDIAYVIRLKVRLPVGQEVEVKESDVEILKVEYLSDDALNEINKQGLK